MPNFTDFSNRFTYHAPKPGQADKYAEIRSAGQAMCELLDELVLDSREKSLAVTKIEEAVFWANAGIARSGS